MTTTEPTKETRLVLRRRDNEKIHIHCGPQRVTLVVASTENNTVALFTHGNFGPVCTWSNNDDTTIPNWRHLTTIHFREGRCTIHSTNHGKKKHLTIALTATTSVKITRGEIAHGSKTVEADTKMVDPTASPTAHQDR